MREATPKNGSRHLRQLSIRQTRQRMHQRRRHESRCCIGAAAMAPNGKMQAHLAPEGNAETYRQSLRCNQRDRCSVSRAHCHRMPQAPTANKIILFIACVHCITQLSEHLNNRCLRVTLRYVFELIQLGIIGGSELYRYMHKDDKVEPRYETLQAQLPKLFAVAGRVRALPNQYAVAGYLPISYCAMK